MAPTVTEQCRDISELQLDRVAEPQRLEALEAFIQRSVLGGSWRVSRAAGPVEASLRGLPLGEARLWRIHYGSEFTFHGRRPSSADESAVAVMQLDGDLEVRRAGHAYRLAPGELYVGIGEPADGVEVVSSSGNNHVLFEFPRKLLRPSHMRPSVDTCWVFKADAPGVKTLGMTLTNTLAEAEDWSPVQRLFTMRAIIELLEVPLADLEIDDRGAWRVQRALSDIEQSLHVPTLSATGVASQQEVSRRRLDELFVRTVGTTVSAYIVERRLRRAAELLQDNTAHGSLRTVADIAVAVGYNDRARFARSFKGRFGVPPSRYAANGESEQRDAAETFEPRPTSLHPQVSEVSQVPVSASSNGRSVQEVCLGGE